jgi:4-amino-4-deoxy-L-arabinose transferase-like glycosyltransferase
LKKNADDQRTWRLFAVFALAMLVRTAYLLSIRHAPFFEHLVTEPARYDAWARDIVRGVAPVRPPFDEGPAYPYFIALVYAIAGHVVFAVTTLQALMDSASCVLVAATAERIAGTRAAWIAGIGAALYGPMIYFAGQLEPATLTVFVTSVAIFLTPVRKGSRRAWLICGAVWALAMLVRSEMILALPFVLIHAWRCGKREGLASVAAPAAGLLAITLAINAASSGHAVLLTTGSGVNFWIGNNEQADGVSPFVEGPMLRTAHEIERQTSDAVVADGLFRDRALSFIAHEPGRALALAGKKALWLCADRELPNAMDIERQEKDSFVFALRVLPLRFGMILPLALAGIASRRKKLPLHLLAPLAVAFVVAVVFFTCARFRMVASPALLVFASLAFEPTQREEIWKKVAAAVLGALLAFANVGDVRGYRIKAIDDMTQTLYVTARNG